MKTKGYILIFFLLLGPAGVHGQFRPFSIGVWHHQFLTGELGVRGTYRQLNSLIGDLNEFQKSSYLTGGLKLNSTSYFWTPDVVKLRINGEFYPEIRDEKYIILPDRSENRTLSKLGIEITFRESKPLSLTSYVNYDNSFYKRENLTDVKNNSRRWGGRLNISNKFVPLSFSFRQTKWRQEETQTNRLFFLDQTNIQALASKSFGRNDKHALSLQRHEYYYKQVDLYEVKNWLTRAILDNSVYFDDDKHYNLNTRVSLNDQTGNYAFKRFEGIARLDFILPKNFRFRANAQYYNLKDPVQYQVQTRYSASISHKLFQSLNTDLWIEYFQTKHSVYEETNFRTGMGLDYTKKIAFGRLNLGYRYFRYNQSNLSEEAIISVINEEHNLSDGEITLFKRPYVDLATVVVKDITGSIFYQINLDYILIVRNNFVEIQRILGGQIANNQTVMVDYQAQQPGSYNFGLNNHFFSVGLLFFDRLLEVYYRGAVQNYPVLEQTEFLTLNYYTQNIVGIRMDVGFARGGIEYDNLNSNIIPYEMLRYYLELNLRLRTKLLMSINGSMRDYLVINYVEKQQYANLSGRVAYNFRARTTASLEIGYLAHRGFQRDLDMVTARAEFNTVFNQIYIKAGLELYQRYRPQIHYLINGVYVQISRKF